MSTATATSSNDSVEFAFVSALAKEMSAGKIELPGFPDIAIRVRRALQDEEVSAEKLVRVIGAEPSLTARLLQLANSAAINRGGARINDLRTAITRVGFTLVRSSSIALAMSQLEKSPPLQPSRNHSVRYGSAAPWWPRWPASWRAGSPAPTPTPPRSPAWCTAWANCTYWCARWTSRG